MFSLFAVGMANTAQAATIIEWADSGWYRDNGFHDPAITNYVAGLCTDCGGGTYRNFFVFDTSAVAGTVTAATLRLRSGFIATAGVYDLFDVTTPIGILIAEGFGRVQIYDDLGTGTQFGSANLPATTAGRITIDIVLNDEAVAAINASPSLFAIGGRYTSEFHAFGGTNTTEVRQLIVETGRVPTPGTVTLIGLGLLGFVGSRRKS